MDAIAVLDFGCQHTHQIGEAVRRAGVFSEILPCETPAKELERFKGIILSGGPKSVYQGGPKCDPAVFSMGKPVLGICYGLQLMATELGGNVEHVGRGEYGESSIRITGESPLLKGFGGGTVWMSHGDSVTRVPDGFRILAESDGLMAAMGNDEMGLYALQFHPEVSHTENGDAIIRNFVLGICGSRPEWSMEDFLESSVRKIREQVGDGHAVIFASGGVDSSVAAALASRALGERVRAIHIDTGLERKGEVEWVVRALGSAGIGVEVEDFSGPMLERLGRETDPERKRAIIGDAYIEALFRRMRGFEHDSRAFLVQGTIYPDTIESSQGVGNKADLIKSHHNVASSMVRRLREQGRLVEPNALLFKHEVRKIARLLGLPSELSERHPFPGPGLGVRHAGRVFRPDDYSETRNRAEAILREHGLEGLTVPVGSVGVKGSARAYGNLVIIRAGREEYETVRKASNMLGNGLRGITRAALLLTGRLPSQQEWDSIEPMPVTREGLAMLREADSIAMGLLEGMGLYEKVSQMPVVMFPGPDKPWIALRPVVTPDFMTLRPPGIPRELPWEYLEGAARRVMDTGMFGGVVLDTTSKPPATTEWE